MTHGKKLFSGSCSCPWFFTNPISALDFFMSWRIFKFCLHFCHLGFFLCFLSCVSCKYSCFFLPFYSSKIADLWRLNYCKILCTNIYWNNLYLKIWWIYSTRNLICYPSIWNKLWNLIRTEKPGPQSVIPQLFLQYESKRKSVTLPLPLTYLNKATA